MHVNVKIDAHDKRLHILLHSVFDPLLSGVGHKLVFMGGCH